MAHFLGTAISSVYKPFLPTVYTVLSVFAYDLVALLRAADKFCKGFTSFTKKLLLLLHTFCSKDSVAAEPSF